ncbi:MAG: hypothetical protein Q9227_001228 [Pyrenula ochraceoflavens]
METPPPEDYNDAALKHSSSRAPHGKLDPPQAIWNDPQEIPNKATRQENGDGTYPSMGDHNEIKKLNCDLADTTGETEAKEVYPTTSPLDEELDEDLFGPDPAPDEKLSISDGNDTSRVCLQEDGLQTDNSGVEAVTNDQKMTPSQDTGIIISPSASAEAQQAMQSLEIQSPGSHLSLETPQKSSDDTRSPTESELLEEGFEFHCDLPEDSQIRKIEDEAFRKALQEVLPSLSRKEQWNAWRKAVSVQRANPEWDGLEPLSKWKGWISAEKTMPALQAPKEHTAKPTDTTTDVFQPSSGNGRNSHLPTSQLINSQIEAQAQALLAAYRQRGEEHHDPNLQASLSYLSQLNPSSQILWLSQQPESIRARANQAIESLKKDASKNQPANFQADLDHLYTLDHSAQLAYLQHPRGSYPLAKKAVAAFTQQARSKGWPLERFQDLYHMRSDQQLDYLFERMDFWPGFAKQEGLEWRPCKSNPEWEGKWPESPRTKMTEMMTIEERRDGGRRGRTPSQSPSPMLMMKTPDLSPSKQAGPSRSVPKSPLSLPPSPKKEPSDIQTSTGVAIPGLGITHCDELLPNVTPVRRTSTLASPTRPKHISSHRVSTPSQSSSHLEREIRGPSTPPPPFSHISNDNFSDSHQDVNTNDNNDITMSDAPPIPAMHPARILSQSQSCTHEPARTSSFPSSPDILASSPPTVTALPMFPQTPSPTKPKTLPSTSTPSSRSLSPPLPTTPTPSAAPSIPKRSAARRKPTAPPSSSLPFTTPAPSSSTLLSNFKVEKPKPKTGRKATDGVGGGIKVKEAVERIEKMQTQNLDRMEGGEKRDVTPRRSRRIQEKMERGRDLSGSPG